jgi:hypothetical protein
MFIMEINFQSNACKLENVSFNMLHQIAYINQSYPTGLYIYLCIVYTVYY